MVYDILKKLEKENRLEDCSFKVSDKSSLRGFKRVFGRDIIQINRSFIQYQGGETGYEKFNLPLEEVAEVEVNGEIVFRKKKRIKKIYPRG